MDLDFKELSNDTDIINRMTSFAKSVDELEEIIKYLERPGLYEQLSNSNKIKYNIFLAFAMNGLFWMYLRAEGVDPTKHQIKAENERVRDAMNRAKQIHDRNTIMPRLNKDAAKRFVRNGLWVPIPKPDNVNPSTNETEENWDK